MIPFNSRIHMRSRSSIWMISKEAVVIVDLFLDKDHDAFSFLSPSLNLGLSVDACYLFLCRITDPSTAYRLVGVWYKVLSSFDKPSSQNSVLNESPWNTGKGRERRCKTGTMNVHQRCFFSLSPFASYCFSFSLPIDQTLRFRT